MKDSDLIRRSDVINAIRSERNYLLAREQLNAEHILAHHFDAIMNDIPAVDAVEVRRGWWLFEEYPDEYYSSKCSLCGFETVEAAYLKGWNFCPNCGAKMDGEEEHNAAD